MEISTPPPTTGRPFEVTIAIVLLIGNALIGLFVAGVGLALWGDALSLAGVVLALMAIWAAFGMMRDDPAAWTIAILAAFIGIPLYAVSFLAIEGIILCIITLFYLNLPKVKQHFTR